MNEELSLDMPDTTNAPNGFLFDMVIEKSDVTNDTDNVMTLLLAHADIRKAYVTTNEIMAPSPVMLTDILAVDPNRTSPLEYALKSKARWKTAYDNAYDDCYALATEVMGASPVSENHETPSYWARRAVEHVQAENHKLRNDIKRLENRLMLIAGDAYANNRP